MTIFKGAAANPVLFAVVGGRTAYAAGDRFFYDYMAPAASYSLKATMDLPLELIGKADGSANQVFTAANAPVYYGRQTLLERTATPGTIMTTTKSGAMMGRYLYVNALDAGVAANDFLVIDDGTANEEYVKVGAVNAALNRIDITSGGGSTGYSTNPLRFTHAAGATVREVTLTFRQEGASNYYTVNPAAGTVTLNGTGTVGNAFVMTYRTDAKFGWKRKAGDAVAPFYYSNLIDDPTLDDSSGDWRGKPLVDGTYTFGLWGYHSIEYRSGPLGAYEWQSYRGDTTPATTDFLYGATATTLTPYSKIDDPTNCDGCHIHLSFHGGTREGAETCLMCHATQGSGVSMRTLAHEWHGDTLPVMPNGAGACNTCHGSTSVEQPPSRNHPTAQVLPSRDWGNACEGCHSSPAASAHIDTMTSPSSGYEACPTCHDPDRDLAVKYMHQAR
jgi:hypothetical protein